MGKINFLIKITSIRYRSYRGYNKKDTNFYKNPLFLYMLYQSNSKAHSASDCFSRNIVRNTRRTNGPQ